MNNNEINNHSFERLLKPGNLGFFNAFECVSVFILDKAKGNNPINVFTIFIAVERDITKSKPEYLTPKRTRVTDNVYLGIERQYIDIESARQAYINLCEYANERKSGLLELVPDEEIYIGGIEKCPASFVPNDTTIKNR